MSDSITRGYVRDPIKPKQVAVSSAAQLSGTLRSDVDYLIDGQVDMGTISIEVPAGGLSLSGHNFNVSGLYSTEDNHTLFTSPVGGSGDFLFKDFYISVSGTNSKVYDLTDATGLSAFECARVNYNDCTSLGELNGYRQGFETGTGRFRGQPELTLSGTWLGGYFIASSIVRFMVDGTFSLFKAGTSFVMNSRFKTNQNVDLPANASFADFAASNFPNPSTIQLEDMIVTRNGVADASDTNIMPNISHTVVESAWRNNQGLPNTHEGGRLTITAEVITTINTLGVFETLDGTWTPTLLEHFDEPVNGQLRHLGNNPREYKVVTHFIVEGPANNDITIRLRKYDSSATTTTTIQSQSRQINSLVGGRDVAFFDDDAVVELDQNDYVFYEIANNSGIGNLSAEVDSFFLLEAR